MVKRKRPTEICLHCGQSVARGSEWYEGRSVDWGTFEGRVESGALHPDGDYVCLECCNWDPIREQNHSRHRAVIRRLRKALDRYYPRRASRHG
jgi:hypothetical protein